jgi:hypothetical protein
MRRIIRETALAGILSRSLVDIYIVVLGVVKCAETEADCWSAISLLIETVKRKNIITSESGSLYGGFGFGGLSLVWDVAQSACLGLFELSCGGCGLGDFWRGELCATGL